MSFLDWKYKLGHIGWTDRQYLGPRRAQKPAEQSKIGPKWPIKAKYWYKSVISNLNVIHGFLLGIQICDAGEKNTIEMHKLPRSLIMDYYVLYGRITAIFDIRSYTNCGKNIAQKH